MRKWAHGPGVCPCLCYMLYLPLLKKVFIMTFAKLQNKGHERIHILLSAGLDGYLLWSRKPLPRLIPQCQGGTNLALQGSVGTQGPSIKGMEFISFPLLSVFLASISVGLEIQHFPQRPLPSVPCSSPLVNICHARLLLSLTNFCSVLCFFLSYHDCQWSPVRIRNTQKWLLPARHRRMHD